MRAELMADRARRLGTDERPRADALLDGIPGEGGPRCVAHDVARVDARVDALLVLGMVRDRDLDRALIGQALGCADEQVLLVEALLLERGAERLERRGRARDDDEAGRLGVEAVDDPRLARRVAD